jgi:hypothetical protein
MANQSNDFNDLLDIAKDFLLLTTKELDKSTSQKGVIKVGSGSVTLFTPSHIQFAKYGRGKGKKPPFEVILDFVKKENIKFDGLTEKGTAEAIRASIAIKGTKNYVKNAPNAIEEAIDMNFKEYSEKLGKAFSITIDNQLAGIYKQIKFDSNFKI